MTSVCARNPFFNNAYKRSVSSQLEVTDAKNFFACSHDAETCSRVKKFSVKNSEKITCHDEYLPIEFSLRNPLTGTPNTTHGYITQQRGGGIVLDQSRDTICKTFKT